MQEKPNRFRITSIVIAVAVSCLMLMSAFSTISFAGSIITSPNESQPTHILSPSTITRFFNLTYADNHNFTNGIGNWSSDDGNWTIENNLLTSGGESAGQETVWNTNTSFKDFLFTVDYRTPMTSANNQGIFGLKFRTSTVTTTYYMLELISRKINATCDAMWQLTKYVSGASQNNWFSNWNYYSGTYPHSTGGIHSSLLIYNTTWMRVTIGMVGTDLFATWGNLTNDNRNTWRVSIKDIGTPITSGVFGFRVWASNAQIKQVLYDYPAFPISMKGGESASVHLATTSYQTPVISGTPVKGVLQNGYWNFTTTENDIGIFNQTFTMTNGTSVIQKKITVAVFPDFTNDGYLYSANPVVANAPGNTSQQLFDPSVIYDSSDGYYKMWVSVNQPAPYSGLFIHYLRSRDGIHWASGGWSNPLVAPAYPYAKVSVIKLGSTYHMVADRWGGAGLWYLTSTNGITWVEQNSGNPIIIPTFAWELGQVTAPYLFYYQNTFYLTFATGDQFYPNGTRTGEPSGFGLAYGPSLTSMTKYSKPIYVWQDNARGNTSSSFGSARPLRYGNSWIAIMNGADPNTQFHATLAMSNDLTNWTVYPDFAGFPLGAQAWCTDNIYTGSIVQDQNGALGFWVNGHDGVHEQIGFKAWFPSNVTYVVGHAQVVTGSSPSIDAQLYSRTRAVGFGCTATNPITVNITQWDQIGALEWRANSTSSQTVTFTLSGLESGALYNVYVDGGRIEQIRSTGSGSITFTYSGPWSEHTFEVELYDPWGPLYDMGPVMLWIGVIVGLTAIVLVMVGSRIRRA